jgi:thymidylate synthase
MNKLDKDYCNLLQDILDNGVKKETRNGGTISVFGRQIRHNMKDGFPLLTTKKVHFKSIVSELLWFLQGRTDLRWLLEQGNTIWVGDAYKNYLNFMDRQIQLPKLDSLTKEEFIDKIKTDDEFAKQWGELGPIYGKQWRSWYIKPTVNSETGEIFIGNMWIDQIANLISELKTNPDSRRLMVSAWNVGELDQMVLPPCHYGFQVYTRELTFEEREKIAITIPNVASEIEKRGPMTPLGLDRNGIPTRAISLMWNQRSVDTPLGLPFNIASYGLLLELLAKMTNMVPDELIGNLGDCHIYTNQIEGVKEQISREPFPLPKLNINTEWWPTEGGECGVGPIDAQAVLNGFSDDNFCKCLMEEDIQLYNYKSHPAIKMPLSN